MFLIMMSTLRLGAVQRFLLLMVPYHGATFDGMLVGWALVPMNSSFLPASPPLALLQTLPAFFGAKRGQGRRRQTPPHEMTATEKRRQATVVFSRWKGKGNERRHRSSQGVVDVFHKIERFDTCL